VRLTVADDAQARERAHAATRDRRPSKRPPNGYLDRRPGEVLDLEPRYCRCERPAPVADVDRQHGVVSVGCLCCGRLRAELNQLDLAALAAIRRTGR
jgi:hypothetical protein